MGGLRVRGPPVLSPRPTASLIVSVTDMLVIAAVVARAIKALEVEVLSMELKTSA